MRVEWAPLAVRRARQAVAVIAAERPAAAAAWMDVLLRRVETLSRFPRRGRRLSELAEGEYRELLHLPYRVVYRVAELRVVVLTIRHVRRATLNGGRV